MTDSYFIVAHFHYVLGTVPVFAVIGGVHFWFPKMTGRMLDRRLAIRSFWVHVRRLQHDVLPDARSLGLSGMPRRVGTYDDHGWQIYNQISTSARFCSRSAC